MLSRALLFLSVQGYVNVRERQSINIQHIKVNIYIYTYIYGLTSEKKGYSLQLRFHPTCKIDDGTK